ncbi:MAG: 23S rRNA pseudouridine(1911/1915/1917) synthase RluD [Ectothiorhodospiraceae bacterium]|nr:23S rRNA pseudouridine(1911/1915/1917) synthase RluD [Ectothiorhodospiraceae bacterium]
MGDTKQQYDETIPDNLAGMRLDQALASMFPDYSRARLQKWIKEGQVSVDGGKLRAKDVIHGGEQVSLTVVLKEETSWRAQAIPLNIVFEDESLIVINKPSGLVVHPGAGNMDSTLSNALLHHAPELENVPRAGIVHRIDKDTTGLLVIARTLIAQKSLVEQLQAREIDRHYQALCMGVMTAGGTIDAPIGRHPVNRTRQAVVDMENTSSNGKEAITHYRVAERYRVHTLVNVQLETGRTHQIRVHMAHINYPLVGDATYGGRLRIPPAATQEFDQALRKFKRQALHAASLGFIHPESGEKVSWQAPLPKDMETLLNACRQDLKDFAKK